MRLSPAILAFVLMALAFRFVAPAAAGIDPCDAGRLGRSYGPLTTIYLVEDGALAGRCHGADDPIVYRAWAQLTQFTTAEERAAIAGFAGFSNVSNQDVIAYAATLDRQQTRFLIAVDLEMVELNPRQVQRVMVHEFAHVLTGTAAGEDSAGAGRGRYLDAWVSQFWSADELDRLETHGPRSKAEAGRRCASDAGFPTEYAATNPAEDFAESFEFYVYSNVMPDAVRPRLQFFHQFPELKAMRDRMVIAGLADTRRYRHECG